ncbi:MAG: hypothetical protein JKY57_01040 [Kordiimonadaceae bacterium]|nr:hypothetical protein [Kordiimonadaceae bacterium]
MKICFFGDSFVNGTGDDECLGWTGRICSDARKSGNGITHYNLGVRGDTSADIMGRWHQEAGARMTSGDDGRLIFSFGANDCALADDGRARLPQNDRLKNARSIFVAAPKSWPTLVVGPLPIADDAVANKRISDLSRQAGVFAKAHKVPYLDVFSIVKDSEIWREECTAGDGVHPGAGGYQVIADLVSGWDAWRSWLN